MKRHRWQNGDTCIDCGMRREAAGHGPYGAARYYRPEEVGGSYKAGTCEPKNAPPAEEPPR
jgi:hypothetical protein